MSDDLSQADLSNRPLQELNAAERAELRRRFQAFVTAVAGRTIDTAPQKPKEVRKWVPGMRATS